MTPMEELIETRNKIHEKISKFFNEIGIVDYCYSVINIDGVDASSFMCGAPRVEVSNIARFQRLVGCIDIMKNSVIIPKEPI